MDAGPGPITIPAVRLGLYRVAALVLLATAVGCAEQKRVYQVDVFNYTPSLICIGLVKTGSDPEAGWQSPEDVALRVPQMMDRHWGTIVEPGKSASIGPVRGRFKPKGEAYLRVYQGDPIIEDLLTYSRGSPQRLDLWLEPGVRSAFIVNERAGRLDAVPLRVPPELSQ